MFLEFGDSAILYSKSTYKNDTLQGKSFIFYPTGELHFLYNYLDGNYHGTAYQYAKDSTVISIFEYNKGKLIRREKLNRFNSNGEKEGLWKVYSASGILREEGSYKNGKKDGIFRVYKYNGELKELKKFNQDELDLDADETGFVELFKVYYPTGELHFTIAKNDKEKRQGITQEYNKKGKIIGTSIYKNDTLIAKGIIDKNGLKQKTWKYYYQGNKVIAKGKFRNDNKIKKWEYYYTDGSIEQAGEYRKGKLSGKWIWYYQSGNPHREENYRRGKEDGEIVEFSDSGAVLTKGYYINGKRDGEWFYQVGDHTEKGQYIDGLKTGEWKHYYRTKQLYFKGSYKNGKPVQTDRYNTATSFNFTVKYPGDVEVIIRDDTGNGVLI